MPPRPVPPAFVFRNPIHFLAFGFGSGLAPFAPGTVGTLAGIPIYWLMHAHLSMPGYGVLVGVLFVLGVWVCGRTSAALGVADHSGIVWDEIVGFLVTMIAAPAGVPWVVAGFVLFRIFDIAKPWPIGLVDRRVHGGIGVMLDDVLAGVYGAVIIAVAARLVAQ